MSAPDRHLDWSDANQRLLVAEFARLKQRLAGHDDARARIDIDAARASLGFPAAIDTLDRSFALSTFERDIVLLAAGVEMDSELAGLCAEAQGQPERRWATFSLALASLADPHWSAITPVRPLRRWRLVEIDDGAGLTAGRLRLDERILHYLAGINYLDGRLQPMLRAWAPPQLMTSAHTDIVERLVARLGEADGALPAVQLTGDDRAGQEDVAGAISERLGLHLHILAAGDIPTTLHEQQALAVLWEREAVLLHSALLIVCGEHLEATRRFADRLAVLVLLAVPGPLQLERSSLRYAVNKPDAADRRRLWQEALGAGAARVDGALDGVAAQFSLSARRIHALGAELAPALAADGDGSAALWRACSGLELSGLEELAQRIEAVAGWGDLVLPEPQMHLLREIAVQVRHRLTVHERWGFAARGARGLGISVLFAGESGTGKTMAAEVLANELRLELFRIDLAAVVSKYIGETEKNLARVFDAAEDRGAILLFDEADALFGKRSEVKDSHDRYANIEISYLLQRMEAYRGLAILTTNQKAALDTAFQRRLRFVVQFTFPDSAEREAIWRGIFPAATPTEGLDYAKLARLSVAGGSIRNIAINAAFRAAEAGAPIGMAHLQHAARSEAAKRERSLSDAETRGWV
jgi:hypothetical protein